MFKIYEIVYKAQRNTFIHGGELHEYTTKQWGMFVSESKTW